MKNQLQHRILAGLAVLMLLAAPASQPQTASAQPGNLFAGSEMDHIQALDETILAPGDLAAGDAFGYSLALDGNTLVVGAYLQDAGGKLVNGAAYIFYASGDQWIQVKKLTAPDGADYDQFGYAVALHGDTLVVGANLVDVNGKTNQGAAYVFYRDQGGAGNWGFVKRLDSSISDSFANFGQALAVQGDEIFVSASGLVTNDDGAGGVFVFRRNLGGTNNWGEADLLYDQAGRLNDSYGSDLDVDGNWLVVGAQRSDITGLYENDGAAFLYKKNTLSGAWELFKKLSASDAHNNDNFGYAVALLGDSVLVGAPFAEVGVKTSAGKAYLFQRDQGGAEQFGLVKLLTASDPSDLAYFGVAASLTPGNAYVSATAALVEFFERGAVYQFEQNQGGPSVWGQLQKITASDGSYQHAFGRALDTQGDQLAVGAPSAGVGGQAYIFSPGAPPVPSTIYLPMALNAAPPITHVLNDGQVVSGPEGMKFGAPAGSLSGPLNLTLQTTGAPALPLFDGATPHGSYYQLRSPSTLLQPAGFEFVIGIPVPGGLPTGQLGLAVYASAQDTLDLDNPYFDTWAPLQGKYDPASSLFLAALPAIGSYPQTVVLVEHSMFASSAASPTSQAAPDQSQAGPDQSQAMGFFALCVSPPCAESLETDVANKAFEIYAELRNTYSYPEPRLEGDKSQIDLDPPVVGISNYYYINLFSTEATRCQTEAGYVTLGAYRFHSSELYLCLDPSQAALTSEQQDTLRHELFHAFQAGFNATLDDMKNKSDDLWVREGTAEAAIKSGVDAEILYDKPWARTPSTAIRKVDIALKSTAGLDPYAAQDVWVYAGRYWMAGIGLDFLPRIFAKGATMEDVLSEYSDFKMAYWKWALNQVFEKNDTMENALGNNPCTLTEAAVGSLFEWDMSSQLRPEGVAPPFEPVVIELLFPSDQVGAEVEVYVTQKPDPGSPDPDFHWKLMRDKDLACASRSDQFTLRWTVAGNERYFAVIANTDPDQSKGFILDWEAFSTP